MAIDALTAITPNDLAAFPDNAAINATGPSATDGTPLTAIGMNNYWHGRQQALLNYAGLTPTGVVESDAVSQEIEAFQKGFAVGPGFGVTYWKDVDPSVNGDRVLLLTTKRGVLIASYGALDAELYVGNANNAAVHAGGGAFYHADFIDGTSPNIAGPYLVIPGAEGYVLRGLDVAGAVDPDGASRFLGDVQLDQLQGFAVNREIRNTATGFGNIIGSVRGTSGGTAAPSIAEFNSLDDDGVNGTPRIGPQTQMINISTRYGITY